MSRVLEISHITNQQPAHTHSKETGDSSRMRNCVGELNPVAPKRVHVGGRRGCCQVVPRDWRGPGVKLEEHF